MQVLPELLALTEQPESLVPMAQLERTEQPDLPERLVTLVLPERLVLMVPMEQPVPMVQTERTAQLERTEQPDPPERCKEKLRQKHRFLELGRRIPEFQHLKY